LGAFLVKISLVITLEKAKLSDLNAVFSLFKEVRAAMEKEGNRTWSHRYPLKVNFKEDISAGQGYLYYENGALVAYIAVSFDPLEDFFWESKSLAKLAQLRLDTGMKDDEDFLLLHRLMIRPSCQGHGLAEEVFKSVASLYPKHLVMFAVYPENLKAMRAYDRYGYSNAGIYPFEYGEKVRCYLYYKRYS
jgi:ribosomal protein S18 acetylase RimI-like enzyme